MDQSESILYSTACVVESLTLRHCREVLFVAHDV